MPKAKRMRIEEPEALATRAAHSMESPVAASSGNQPQNVVVLSEEQLDTLAQKVAQKLGGPHDPVNKELDSVNVEDIIAKAMVEVQSVLAGEYDEVLAEKKSAIMKVVRKRVEAEAKITKKLAPLVTKEAGPAELEAVMSTILPAEEIQLIKNTFLFETYEVEVYKCSIPGPKSFVSFLREGEKIFPDSVLASSKETIGASVFQWASIVIEIFMLVLSAIGIKVSFKEKQMEALKNSVEAIIQSSVFRKALDAFKTAWATGGNWSRAKAIFWLLKDSFSAGIFWKLIKAILFEMSAWEYIRAVAEIAAMIVAAFATAGVALIAKIALALNDAAKLVQKLVNITTLEMIQAEHTN